MKRLVVLAIAGVLAGCGEKAEVPAPSAPSPTEARADAVVACGLAMLAAEKRGLVSKGAQLQTPWRVYEVPSDSKGVRRVSCAAIDDRGELGVMVDVACTDVNDEKCHPLVRIVRP